MKHHIILKENIRDISPICSLCSFCIKPQWNKLSMKIIICCAKNKCHIMKTMLKQKPIKGQGGHTCFHFIFITLCHSEVCWYDQTPTWPHWGEEKTHHWWRYSGETTGYDPFCFSSIFWVVLTLLNKSVGMLRIHSLIMYMKLSIQKSLAVCEIECMCQGIVNKL